MATPTPSTGASLSVSTATSSSLSQGDVNSTVLLMTMAPAPSTVATVYWTIVPGFWPVSRSLKLTGLKKRPQRADCVGTSAIMTAPEAPAEASSPDVRKTWKPASAVLVSSHENVTPQKSSSEGTTSAGLPS